MTQPREGATGPKGQTVVIGPWAWGSGDTLAEAKKKFQAQGARLSDGYTVLVFDADTMWLGINDMGTYFYKGNAPASTTKEPIRKAPKRPDPKSDDSARGLASQLLRNYGRTTR